MMSSMESDGENMPWLSHACDEAVLVYEPNPAPLLWYDPEVGLEPYVATAVASAPWKRPLLTGVLAGRL